MFESIMQGAVKYGSLMLTRAASLIQSGPRAQPSPLGLHSGPSLGPESTIPTLVEEGAHSRTLLEGFVVRVERGDESAHDDKYLYCASGS